MSIPPHSFPDFSELARSLMLLKNRLDQQIKDFEKDAQEIRQYYAPRARFERWKATEDGKVWKEKQYKRQQGRCGSCAIVIAVKGSHIDHIQPISKFPELAIDVKNLRLLCPDCNIKKGNKCENPLDSDK
jgi:5-methylcytosine-specific restriction endonuclease McrA